MPRKGQSAQMMAALQAEHATPPQSDTFDYPSHVTGVTTLQPSDVRTPATSKQLSGVATPPTTHEPSHASMSYAEPSTDFPGDTDTPSLDERAQRLHHALLQAERSEMAVVTVRIPASLNRYMDAYTARINRVDPKRKYRKQDAVLYAFARFYADHPMPAAPNDDEL